MPTEYSDGWGMVCQRILQSNSRCLGFATGTSELPSIKWEDSGWRDFRRQRSGFHLGHVDFGVSIKHPDGDAEGAVGFKRLEFKERSESISLGWRYNFGSHGCRDCVEVKEVDDIT